jgi:cytosine/uracil/thiamine/allantoin permease
LRLPEIPNYFEEKNGIYLWEIGWKLNGIAAYTFLLLISFPFFPQSVQNAPK